MIYNVRNVLINQIIALLVFFKALGQHQYQIVFANKVSILILLMQIVINAAVIVYPAEINQEIAVCVMEIE